MKQIPETTVILLYAVFLNGKPVFNPGKFPYSKCIQTSNGISCERLNITKGRHEIASLWPPGPYAVPMSRFGCPEWPSQGWKKGVLRIKHSPIGDEAQIRFCVKTRQNPDLDNGKWIPGMYSIYKAGLTCPEGFVEFNRTRNFEKFSQSEFTLSFTILNDPDRIQFHMCARNSTNSRTDFSEYTMLQTEFMLEMAGESGGCLQLDGTLDNPQPYDAATYTQNNTHCLYMPVAVKKSSQEILDFFMSEGNFASSGKKSGDRNLVWYQFDMRRTLSVTEIVVETDSTMQESFEEGMYVQCFYDNVVWSFLHGKAFECNAESSLSPQTIKFNLRPYRTLHARYFTLVFDETSGHQRIKSKESVHIFPEDLPYVGLCNEDLGMADGSIHDFQITRSSWRPEYLPTAEKSFSTGWCTEEADSTPWILVDLISVTMVDGVSIWNIGESHNTTSDTDKRCSSFYLFYGTDIEAMSIYDDMDLDINQTVADVQSFILLNPIEARYLKLEFHGCHGNGRGCIKFELHGCKLSGLLRLNCSNASKMVELETTITTETKPMIQNDSSTAESCSSSCLQNENCSVARYDGYCRYYPVGHFGMRQLSENWNGTLYAKLCAGAPVELFPTLFYLGGAEATNLEKVNKDAVITTIGYPFPYDIGQHYKWLLQFQSYRYVRLAFTDVSLGYIHETCYDTIYISKGFQTDTKGNEIDHLYNGRGFVIETSESILFLSFMSCLTQRKVTERGFRAIITGEEIPACLTIDLDMLWSEGRNEVCTEPKMILSSMSVLNLPFVNVNETWEIRAGDHQSVQLQIMDFYVVCSRAENGSTFAVHDMSEEMVYCNTAPPPDVITSKTYSMTIRFHRYKDPRKMLIRTEGFRLAYSVINHSYEKLIDTFRSGKVCSKTFRKCYRVVSSVMSWDEAAVRCREGDLQLVSVGSQHEMQFINYLLRELRNREKTMKMENYTSTFSFTAHVGLRRSNSTYRKNAYTWDNSSPVTFSLWAEGNYADSRDCTRTNFKYFLNNTWESEACSTDFAQYFVCQSVIEGNGDMEEDAKDLYWCPERWIEHEKTCYFFERKWPRTFDDQNNFCKDLGSIVLVNADVNTRAWLLTREDYYFVCKKDVETIQNNCDDIVLKYGNKPSLTFTGNRCQNWGNLTEAARADFEIRFPDLDVPSEASNDCLDPTNLGILWCYTTGNGEHLWEPCFMQPFSTEDSSGHAEIIPNTSNDTFECEDGSEIPILNRCDGLFHCKDFSDEIFCTLKEHYLTSSSGGHLINNSHRRLEKPHLVYLCGSSEWVSMLAKCDDVIDCNDASDELNCSVPIKGCDPCDKNSSDPSSHGCNLTPECIKAEDDFRNRPCMYNEWECDSFKQCILKNKMCNGIEDCADGSDEGIFCEGYCENSFACDLKCLPLRLTYDEYADCDDAKDVSNRRVESLLSCDDWWDLGYRTSGKYVIADIPVFCDFSSMESSGKITMSVRNIDVNVGINRGLIYTRSLTEDYVPFYNTELQNIIYRDDYKCFLEIRSTCQFHYAASITDDSDKCQCTIEKFKATKHTYKNEVQAQYGSGTVRSAKRKSDFTFVRQESVRCNGGNDTRQRTTSERYYNVTSVNNITTNSRILRNEMPILIEPWEVTCTFEHRATVEKGMVSCEGDGSMKRCVFDVDAAGYMTGCQRGSHLQNCGNYSCPLQTVKCPGSYCIPLRFVCDGNIQCPGGEDEYECACANTLREVFILVEDRPDQQEIDATTINLAKQLYTTGSDIRILRYKTQVPLSLDYNIEHRLLEIQEERFHPFQSEIHKHKCSYKTMARDLFSKVVFSGDKSKGVIFIEDSTESSLVGWLMFSNLLRPKYTIYRVFKDVEFSLMQNNSQTDDYEFVKDVPVKRWDALSLIGHKRFPEICKAETEVPCSGGYRCSSSKQCIPVEQLCDGIAQCSFKDDEILCDIICPDNCSCVGYSINCHGANLKYNVVKSLHTGTRSADLSGNPKLSQVLIRKSLRFPLMVYINLSSCNIEIVTRKGFYGIRNLNRLDISQNIIKRLPDKTFSDLTELVFLNMDRNIELEAISPSAFHGMRNIKTLQITRTKLKRIASFTFANMSLHVQVIDISYNDIEEIEKFAFWKVSVEKLDFRGNNILSFDKGMFDGVSMIQELQTPAYKFCCIRPCFLEENACYPLKNEFSSCGDLMRHPVLQALIWLVGITATLGNIATILYRLVYDRKRLKIGYGIFVTNLAAADFLMGVYLVIIGLADTLYRSRYIFMDAKWRNSYWCVTAGVLSTVSSEASVLFLCLITLDRLLVIKYPFGTVRFRPKAAHLFCVASWVISVTLAIIPLVFTGYFQNKFYSRSGVCVALPLTRDKPPGWVYSVSIFIGFNFCTFILVAFGQMCIYIELRKTTGRIQKTMNSRKRDLQVARNLILVATTDFLCWFPVGVMGIMALNGYRIPGDVYAWTVVFILPLNSALNPILYTLIAIIGKQRSQQSTEEQDRTEIQKAMGSALLRQHDLIRSVRLKSENVPICTVRSVHDILNHKRRLSTVTVVPVGLHLLRYICLLHESSMVVDNISENTIFVRLHTEKNEKVSIVLDAEISIARDAGKLQDNIHQFGILLRRILVKLKK